jgi:lipid-A-disaccharide synthase
MIVAGELSGDMYGGRLARALLKKAPGTVLSGIGGDNMAEAGVRIDVHINDLSVMGIWDVLREARRLKKILARARESLRNTRPDGLILIDFYRFNIELAREAKRFGIPVVYYVAPKLWVWGEGRIKKLRQYVDHILAIFPFEEEYFSSRRMPVSYVGNPLTEILSDTAINTEPPIERENDELLVALLPGSRPSEVRHLLPRFLGTAELISRKFDGKVTFHIPLPRTIPRELVEEMIGRAGVEATVIQGRSREILRISDVALVASGTATLEAFLLGTPQIVAYHASWLSYFIGKRLVRIEHFSLPNILAGSNVVEELLQTEVTPERLAREALDLLEENSSAREEYLKAGREVLHALRGGEASRLAAEKALQIFSGNTA